MDRVTVHYGRETALDGLTLELRSGELLGLMGPSGAGKSTTLRVLTGQLRPDSGQVTVAGRDLVRDWNALKSLVGYVPDGDNHFVEFSARRNLLIFAGLHGVARARVDECLGLVELTAAADMLVRTYSLGMRRKLLLARALLHRPRLLYLDEPTANLDACSAELVCRILRNLAAEGCAIVLATHNLLEARALCDRVAVLRRGQVVTPN